MMETPLDLSIADTGAATSALVQGVTRITPMLEDAARDLVRRITTHNWTLEWGMPRWIGEALHLPVSTIDGLSVANAHMLAYIRLADDLADGDARSDSVPLSIAVYHRWVQSWLQLFAGRSPRDAEIFWNYFDAHLSHWLASTLDSAAGREPSNAGYNNLPERGAALRIVCGGACVLAAHMDALPLFERATDNLMVSVVLLDDYFDWAQDLDAGRHNTFVAWCSEHPQTEANRATNRRVVLRQLCLGNAAGGFLDQAIERAATAAQSAESVGCEGLARFARWYGRECLTCAAAAREEATKLISDYLSHTPVVTTML